MTVDRTTAAYWTGVVEAVYSSITGLNPPTDYSWDDSDRWTQARGPLTDNAPTRHLECWYSLGEMTELNRKMTLYQSTIEFSCRYSRDNDSVSIGRCYAARQDLLLALIQYGRADGVRMMRFRSRTEAVSSDWLVVTITFETHIPWRP